MAIGYRSILHLESGQDAIETAERRISGWLRHKQERSDNVTETSWDGEGVHELGPSIRLTVVHLPQNAMPAERRLYRLREVNQSGTWTVSVYAVSTGFFQQLIIEVDQAGVDDLTAIRTTNPPALARQVLEQVSATDGAVTLTGRPQLVSAAEVPTLIEHLLNPRRIASVVVAGSLGTDAQGPWMDAVDSLTHNAVGTSAVHVLAPEAMEVFADALPRSHRLRNGSVRTYLPDVDLDDETDGERHRWLSPRGLTDSLYTGRDGGLRVASSLRKRHAFNARQRFVDMRLPDDVRHTRDLLERAENRLLRSLRVERARVAAPKLPIPDGPETTVPTREPLTVSFEREVGALLEQWLGTATVSAESIARLDALLTEKQSWIDALEEDLEQTLTQVEDTRSQVTAIRADRDDLVLELQLVKQDQVESDRHLSILRQRLTQLDASQTHVEPEDDEDWLEPGSVTELVDRLSHGSSHPIVSRVEFTGDRDGAEQIDERYTNGMYASTLWQYARVLHDYVVACEEGFSGSVHHYLNSDMTPGVKCSSHRHAAGESESVANNAAWRAERKLPVPKQVSPDGRAYMDAHFRPSHRDSFAPRMHYYADVSNTGKVYIGYIGRHLGNTSSSNQ